MLSFFYSCCEKDNKQSPLAQVYRWTGEKLIKKKLSQRLQETAAQGWEDPFAAVFVRKFKWRQI
jgi:hypothetical protein